MSTDSRGSSNKENVSILGKCRESTGNISSKVHDHQSSNSESDDSDKETDVNVRKSSKCSDSEDSDSDFERILVKRKKAKRETSDSNNGDSDYSRDTLPVSPVPSSASDDSSDEAPSIRSSRNGSTSPTTPDGEWEIQEIRDYVRDDYGELYLIKWKNWSDDFNTWEPLGNLLNCEDEILRFYEERKSKVQEALANSEYHELPNGKRRRKGPRLQDVPPDPRPFDERVQEFFNRTGEVREEDILKVLMQWKNKKFNHKTRWPMIKVSKSLEDGSEGKLSESDVKALKNELIFIEVERRQQTLIKEIKGWEASINEITGGRPTITIENDVDMTGPPIEFKFVNDYIAGEGVEIPKDPPVGCLCGKGPTSCYDERKNCCAMQFGYKFAYTRFRKVNVLQGSPIYECNSKCMCGPECPNRVVQDGKSDHKLSIFRTSNGCGWGVKTLKAIKKGTFVTLYVGEVIKSEEADRRGKLYDEIGCTYLFDLDFNDAENYPYSVDASRYGNISHFINHSCEPNLGVYAVWTDCLDPNLPKLAMFALKDIAKNEELTFDYDLQLTSDSRSRTIQEEHANVKDERVTRNRTRCLCGKSKCRKFIL